MELAPTEEQLARATHECWAAVEHNAAAQRLADYYDPTGPYAGATFLQLGPNHPNDVTAADLYALSTLDVRARPRAGRRLLLPGRHRERVLKALADDDLPDGANLRGADESVYRAAERLYLAVKEALGANPWVTASKLCARKRPHFFPVRDRVVTVNRLGLGDHWRTDWMVFQHVLANEALMTALAEQQHEANSLVQGVEINDPALRVLDVLLWMTAPREPSRRAGSSGQKTL